MSDTERYVKGGVVPEPSMRSISEILVIGDRIWGRDGRTYEYTGGGFTEVDDPSNPWHCDAE